MLQILQARKPDRILHWCPEIRHTKWLKAFSFSRIFTNIRYSLWDNIDFRKLADEDILRMKVLEVFCGSKLSEGETFLPVIICSYFSYNSIGKLSGSAINVKRLFVVSSVRICSAMMLLFFNSSIALSKLSTSNARCLNPVASGPDGLWGGAGNEKSSIIYSSLRARSNL